MTLDIQQSQVLQLSTESQVALLFRAGEFASVKVVYSANAVISCEASDASDLGLGCDQYYSQQV